MHHSIAAALETPTPGWLVRRAGFLPGVATTGHQIVAFADHWRQEAERALQSERPLLVALGDSLTQGIGASRPTLGYVGLLSRELGLRSGDGPLPVLNLSRSGARIEDVLSLQLPALAALDRPIAALTCTVGSNDLVRSPRLGRARRDMTRLVEQLPPGTTLASLPAKGSLAAIALNRHLLRRAARHGLTVADVNAGLNTWRGHRAGDRFHPNDAGYRIWLNAFLSELEPASAG